MPEFYTKTQLLDRDWSNSRIVRFLGPPDKVLPNPKGFSSRDMRLYDKKRVHEAEDTIEFGVELAKLEALRRKRSPPSDEELEMDWCEFD